MKFSIKNFFSKLRIWSHLLKKFLMENFIFCAVNVAYKKQHVFTFDNLKIKKLSLAFSFFVTIVSILLDG